MKRRGKGPTQRAKNMQSVLFSRSSRASMDSVVVPETPTNSISARPSLAPVAMSVMETPEDQLSVSEKPKPSIPLNDNPKEIFADCSSEDEFDDSNMLDITPDLKLGKKRNLMSILESEDSFAKSLKSQRTKNSSMLIGCTIDEAPEKEVLMVSPVKKNRRRKSVANMILPFDLNDTESLSNKLRNIEECDKKSRRSVGGLAIGKKADEKGKAKERRKSVGHVMKSQNDLLNPNNSSDEEVIFSTQKTTPQYKPNALKKVQRSICVTKETTKKNTNQKDKRINTPTKENAGNSSTTGNVTKFFDSEDLDLTSIKTPSQDRTIQNIITSLNSQPESQTDNMLPLLPSDCGVPGMSFQNFSTLSVNVLQARISEEEKKEAANNARREELSDWMEQTCVSESAATERDIAQTLRGVVAYVEVRMDCDNRSEVIKEQLKILGAEVRDRFTMDPSLTHVIFKDGSKAIFNRAMKRGLHLVSSLWVEACREKLERVPESLYPSCSIESYKTARAGKKLRKLKSMQPKEFSEEERIASAKVQKRMKMISGSPVKKEQFFTPTALNLNEESKDSPLFGISHLLTPQRCSTGSTSTTDTETEELEGGSPPKYMTPLKKRLYDRFLSPRTESNQRRRMPTEVQSPLSLTGVKQKLKCSSEDSSDSQEENVKVKKSKKISTIFERSEDSSNQLREKSSMGSHENCINGVDNASKNIDKNANASEREDRGIRMRKQRTSRSVSQEEEASNITATTGSLETSSNLLRGSQSLDLALSDSSQGSSEEMPSKRESGRRKNSASNLSSDESSRKKRKSLRNGQEASNSVDTLEIEKLAIHIEDPTNKENVSMEIDDDKNTSENDGKRRQSILKKADSTNNRKANKRKSVRYSDIEISGNETGDVSQPAHTPDKKSLNLVVPPTFDSPILDTNSQPSCSMPSSQLRGHKLLSLDLLEPSQELIVPSTPEDPKKFLRGPYMDLVIRDSKTQRAAMKQQKGGSLSIPLPRKSRSKKLSAPSQLVTSSQVKSEPSISQTKNSAPVRRSMRLQSAPLRKESQSDDVFLSSDDEFKVPKIHLLPRPRRSTEEFQFSGSLAVKGKRGRKPKNNLPSLYITSVHTKEKQSLIPIIQNLGGFRITEIVDETTTHVVCGEARRTLNLLLGIARGAWILDVSWVFESLDMSKWAPEEPFELFTTFPGAKIARQQREEKGKGYTQTLFSGVGFIHVLEGCTPPSQQLRDLLQLTGAKVVPQIRSANVAIGKPLVVNARSLNSKVPHLSEKWVLDSIQHHKIQPFLGYLLQVVNSTSSASLSSEG